MTEIQHNHIYTGDALEVAKTLPDGSIHCVITSPPYYGLRDYGIEGQGGLQETPEQYVEWLVVLFRELRRVLQFWRQKDMEWARDAAYEIALRGDEEDSDGK